MKRKDLIRLLEKNGWVFFREGGNHTTYAKNDLREQIPRHHEIDETLAKYIIKKRELK